MGRRRLLYAARAMGSANAIVATTTMPIPAADGGALISLNITSSNTATPVTVSFNGAPPLTIKTNAGNNPVIGGLVAGMTVAGYKVGAEFRLLSDQASAAIVLAAEEAAIRAENAAGSIIANASFKTVAALLSDDNNLIGYAGSGAAVTVASGDIVNAQGFRYEVAASNATDEHVETAGGVKLYVLKLNGCWYAEAFGVVTGDWATDTPGDIVDSTAPFQAALNALKSRETLHLPSGTIYTGDVTIPYGVLQVTLQGEGSFTPVTVIKFLDGATQGFMLGMEAYSFKNIIFKGVGDVTDAALFTSIRNDNRVDMDWAFFNCMFTDTRHVGKMLGRGLTVDNCIFGTIYDDAWILDYPNPANVILEPAGYMGSLEGGFRGFTIRDCRIHGFSQHMFRVNGNNAENARGFTITGNQCDSFALIIKGYAQEVVFTGNNWYNGWNTLTDACLFDLVAGRAITISGNVVACGSSRIAGDNPLVRFTSNFSALAITGNTFVRRDVPILTALLASGNAVSNVVIADNTYVDCFVTADHLVKITGATGLVNGVKIDEVINGVPVDWLAVNGDSNWRNAAVRVITNLATKQHNIPAAYSRGNEPVSGAYSGNGTTQDVFVGYTPKIVRVYRNARRIINADVAANGEKIAGYAVAFERALYGAGYSATAAPPAPAKPAPAPAPAPKPEASPAPASGKGDSISGAILGIIVLALIAAAAFILGD